MTGAQIAVLGHGRAELPSRGSTDSEATRGMTMTAFMLLAVYGVLRWSTMLRGSAAGHLFGLLLLTLAIVWLGGHCGATRLSSRVAVAIGIFLAALAMIPVSGFPLRWVLDLRIAVLARAIGHGLSALPHVIVPYSGTRVPTGAVIILGAGMLLLAGALALATTRPQVGQARLIASAVPLIVLAIVPSVLAEPQLASLHGVLLLLGLLALLFSERVSPLRVAGALTFALLTAVLALILAPAVESSHAWINVKKIGATRVHPGERFNWSQGYGPLNWPRQGTEVMSVGARFPTYWKAEDLDLFNGHGWQSSSLGERSSTAGVSRSSRARWTESLTVTLSGMSTTNLIAAGVASAPRSNVIVPIRGTAPGTWQTVQAVGPGTSYHVEVYSPQPSKAQLAASPARYSWADLASELQIVVPRAPNPPAQLLFRPFGSRTRFARGPGFIPRVEAGELEQSSYGPVFRLAQRLRSQARTPYAYVEAVLRYLGHGFTYEQNTLATSYPLLTFLLHSHAGYCQQFAGAMALLLRMEGIPAHVAAGFTSGVYDRKTHAYRVADLDAHAWVEAWFAGYGWVTFDPTPSSDPALSGISPLPAAQSSSAASGLRPHSSVSARRAGAAAPEGPRHRAQTPVRSSGGVSVLPILLIGLVALLLGLAGLVWRAPRTPEGYVEELERAFSRTRRPLAPEVTLASLERRFADSPEAVQYVRALGRARFAGQPIAPSAEQRRAVRRRLARGLGPLGRVWALVALPPLVRRLH